MILATVNTGSFDFTALGDNEDHCENLLALAWNRHCDQTPGADPDLMVSLIADHGVNFAAIKSGTVLRDGSQLYPERPVAKGYLDDVLGALRAAGVEYVDQRWGGYPTLKVPAPTTGNREAYYTVQHDDDIEAVGREFAVFYHYDGRRGAATQIEADTEDGNPLLTVEEVVGTVSNAPLC